MGVDMKKALPLPAPTETESTTPTELATEVATDVSKPVDDKSSYSIPEDGTPVTIKTRGHRASKSQTSLLIEYFEGGKPSNQGASSDRKPSVRVRLTPSKNRKSDSSGHNGHIEITQTKSRKASLTRRAARAEQDMAGIEGDDAKSFSSYASATEESNVSRNPIEVEIDRGGGHRRRRPASPLIPAADSKVSYAPPSSMSEISAIPTDSFLDGSGPSKTSTSKRSADLLTGAAAGAAAGVGAAVVADKLRNKSRVEDKERIVIPKSKDREKSERKHRSSKSRTSSVSEMDGVKSPRRRSSRGHQESAVSAVESSMLSSALSGSYVSQDQRSVRSGASKSSINNPKLLETVEDAIRRLILPELNALKREQSRKGGRRGSTTSSATSISKEEYTSDRRRSSGHKEHGTGSRDITPKVKERRDREARHDYEESPTRSDVRHESYEDSIHEIETPTKRSTDKLKLAAAAAAGAGIAAAAMRDKSPVSARETRRRRRAEAKGRGSDTYLEQEEESDFLAPGPPMPLMSEINPSEMTRTSILSADTDRPTSASDELMPVHEVSRGVVSRESITPTPSRPASNVQALGAHHENVSHGDLKALPRNIEVPTLQFDAHSAQETYDRELPLDSREEYETVEDYDVGHGPVQYDTSQTYDQYGNQIVPAPLKYTPYQPERRGLSPIPSVSGYTEGGSEVHTRDSRLTTTTISSPEKSPRHDRGAPSPGSIASNVRSRGFDEDDRSLRSSGVGLRNAASADSDLNQTPGQDVRRVGATAKLVNSPFGVESNVASLVDGSMLEDSVLSGEPGYEHRALQGRQGSMGTLEEETSHGHATLSRHSYDESRGDLMEDEEYGRVSPATTGTNPSEFEMEYEIDPYGRKIPKYKQSHVPSAKEAAITAGAVGAAAAAIKALKDRNRQPTVEEVSEPEWVGGGVQRNKSFKERTMEGHRPANTPTHSIDRLSEYEAPHFSATHMPDKDHPMPEIGYYDDVATNPSVVEGPLDGSYHGSQQNKEMHLRGDQTPTQRGVELFDKQQAGPTETNEHGLGITEAAGAAALATAAAMAAQHHSRQPSQDVEEDWPRTSADRKRDTLITNPYEGTSPVVNENLLKGTLPVSTNFDRAYHAPSPLGHKVDEGYISQGPNKSPDVQLQQDKAKGVDFSNQPNLAIAEDPFYQPKHVRHMSGLSQGMGSPLYDAATGAGLDRIENKDIIALMQHLMVRDAQRSARDTEILVTLVRAASEMREKFEYMEKQLKTQEKGLTMELRERMADTEDVIITEVKENTEKTVRNHIGGPRPFPGSGARSLKAASQAETEDLNTKKSRNLLRRAFKGLSAKGNNDLGRIEDMLNQLLAEVDVLKSQTAPGGTGSTNTPGQLYDGLDPETPYEQDRGYEPDGPSTVSHASQSGPLSLASRGPSAKLGYERKFSDHRISTVPEADEGELDQTLNSSYQQHFSDPNMLTPNVMTQRGGSVPISTPPQPQAPQQGSLSNDNTPRTEKGKKHKSSSSSSWFPKISRWSATTASSKGFRNSKDSKKDDFGDFPQNPSRSGSDLAAYPDYRIDAEGDDKLHTGFSQPDLLQSQPQQGYQQQRPQTPPELENFMPPEDPKYHGFRNSMNLQHPQPRTGQPFTAALEHQYYDSPMSPGSVDWAGSTTSLRRHTEQNQNRYSNGSATNEAHRQYWPESPAQAGGPPRPPKEPLDEQARTPAKSNRISKLQKSSPLPHQSVESGYGTATHGAPTQYTGSPKLENRNLSGALGVPTRRPSGPRAMTPKSPRSPQSFQDDEAAERRRKRDTFGTVTSQESETF